MIRPQGHPTEFDMLRSKIEELIKSQPTQDHQLSKNILGLIHKLQTHQAELEIQNKALQECGTGFRALLNNAPIAYHTMDDQCHLVEVNQRWLDMLGYSKDEVLGKSFLDFVDKAMHCAVKKYCSLEKMVNKDRCFDFTMCKKNGEPITVECQGSIGNGGAEKPSESYWIIRDITRQKKAELEREQIEIKLRHAQKMHAIGTLAGGVAHEFNNMLGIIIGNTELGMDDIAKNHSVRDNLEEIRMASLRAKEVVYQLLAFASKDATAKTLVKIGPLLKQSLRLVRSTLPANIKLEWHNSNQNLFIDAIPARIQDVIINLCANATEAISDKKGTISIQLGRVEIKVEKTCRHGELTPGSYVKIEICDNGTGISRKNLDHIFDPFFTTKEAAKGMGLAVVHGVVNQHNGHIDVKSEPGRGTTFSLFFPLQECDAEPDKRPPAQLPKGSEHILFVDDEPALIKVNQIGLEKLGYKVTTSKAPLKALNIFREAPDMFDLVITDMTMPEMTGDELAIELLNIRPDLPIILCTGYSEEISKEKARDIGILSFAFKPLDKAQLAAIIREVLDTSIK